MDPHSRVLEIKKEAVCWFIECKSILVNSYKILHFYATSISAKCFKDGGVTLNESWLHSLGLLTQ